MTKSKNLGDLIDRSRDFERTAVIDLNNAENPRIFSHGKIDRLANGVARHLVKRGFPRGSRVAIVSLNRAEYVAAYFGIMRAGYVAVPVNTKLPRATIDTIMDDAAVVLAFVDDLGRGLVRNGIPAIDFDDPGGFAAQIAPGEYIAVEAGPQEIAQMLYTSGSTGRPKGVPLTHAGQLWALSKRTTGPGAEDERTIVAQPLFHMNGLFATKTVFANNASMVMMPAFEARAYTAALAKYRVTAIAAIPTMLARVIKETDLLATLDFSALARITLGSAPITMTLYERIAHTFPRATITIGYGTTETGPAIFGPHPRGLPTPPLALGVPLEGSEVRLVDGPSADEGVLMMRNPAVMAGYNNLPEQTANALRDGWYYSGDVMRRDADGFYYFVGRIDDMFVCAGENIYPTEVEKLLERHPSVQQAAVVPLPDEERGQVPVAFVVRRPQAQLTADEVRTFALANGPAYQYPRRLEFVTELPWAGTNKIDRKALIERARELEAAGAWSR